MRFSLVLLVLITLLSYTANTQVAHAHQGARNGSSISSVLVDHKPGQVDETVIHVPSQEPSLQTAISQVIEGGIIELASGTYYAPSGGFQINNLQKGFTIRAAQGAQVTLDGGGYNEVLRFVNSSLSTGRPVIFQDLKFANGYTNTAGIAAGATLYYAEATFVRCAFQNNIAGSFAANAGGVFLGFQSKALFIDSIWLNNSAVHTGGGLRLDGSKAYIYNSQFTNNRTNLPNHSPTSSGGAISVLNSVLRVSDTRFENNQAGYVAGGIYVLGSWTYPPTTPQSDVVVTNSTFINNLAQRDPTVSYNAPTEGGALHAEAQSAAKIYHSRFITNSAMSGGAITLYQASLLISDSIFEGNQATGNGSIGGYGGAISASSNDVASDGYNNRPSVSLTIQNSLFQGQYGSVTHVAQGGGGIYVGGDINRTYGLNGVPKMGNLDENRAKVVINNVVFYDLDVQKANWGGAGGSIYADLVNLTIQNSLIAKCDASGGSYSSGGGLAAINQSHVNLSDSVIAKNSSTGYGGGVFIQGATINLSNSKLIENSMLGTNYGSAIFTAPLQEGYGSFAVDGEVQGCTISNNTGLPIFDDDRTWGPINDVRYNNNNFYHNGGTEAIVYSNPIYPYGSKTVFELNNLVVERSNGTSTQKSQLPNTALTTIPITGGLFAAPGETLSKTAFGDSETTSPAYLVYAWSGASSTLDGSSVTDSTGLQTTFVPGTHTLSVGGMPFSAQVTQAPQPMASFTASFEGGNITLAWSVPSTTFLDAIIDQGVVIPCTPSGSIQVSGTQDKTYYFYTATQEWGNVQSVSVGIPLLSAPSSEYVLTSYPPFNYGAFTIYNTGGGVLNWTAQTTTQDLITLINSSGQAQISSGISFIINTIGRSPGIYMAYVQIDAGEAGGQSVMITIDLVASLNTRYLPISIR